MVLRDARLQADRAEEEGHAAFLSDPGPTPRVNERLLKGEIAQAQSFNKRCGVDAAALPPQVEKWDSPCRRQASALDGEYDRRAISLRDGDSGFGGGSGRGGGGDRNRTASAAHHPSDFTMIASVSLARSSTEGAVAWTALSRPLATDRSTSVPQLSGKRQRVGGPGRGPSGGMTIGAAEEEAARQAAEDVALATPLLRPPASTSSRRAGGSRESVTRIAVAELWPTKKLRVRVVDEAGAFRESHLRKGVVRRADPEQLRVDLELDASGHMLRGVPQDLLETVVSKGCQRVEVVRGPHRGMVVDLVGRESRRNLAIVRVNRALGGVQLQLQLDDVCEFV
eukprot:TRINITY_DN75544_c0_g1_i1.p1 TRINITY_DN75544_c0_g1~~TRINITY_DN75544_c0_g1_i1.p1  ORF type:complete len:391 (+),score=72.39 TRINITY_DN75544_c0_g1_i1:158-1174(+)